MAGSLRISKIKFYAGAFTDDTPLEIDGTPVTVFVGPNDSGKSLALREIGNWCFANNDDRKIIEDIEIDFPKNPNQAVRLLKKLEVDPPKGRVRSENTIFVGQPIFGGNQSHRLLEIDVKNFKQQITKQEIQFLRSQLLSSYVIRLDGRTRFALTSDQDRGDLLTYPENHFQALFNSPKALKRLKSVVQDAFPGLYLHLDPTGPSFRIRISDKSFNDKSLSPKTIENLKEADLIHDFGDGVQAFVGLMAAVISLPHKIILIDEPEAFLHPPQARRLAAELTRIAAERKASLIIATHSSDILRGCTETNLDSTVLRLTYN